MLRLVPLLLALGAPALAVPDGGAGDAAGDADQRLRTALAACMPGSSFPVCVAALRASRVDVQVEDGAAHLALGGAFIGVTIDGRSGDTVVDVAFRAIGLAADAYGDIADFLEQHTSAYPFSEPCKQGASFCGVFYPKQRGGSSAVEIGFGLMEITGKPAWRKPSDATVEGGAPVYGKDERILDVRHTPARGLVVQFSVPLGRDGRPSRALPLLRRSYEQFIVTPYVRAP